MKLYFEENDFEMTKEDVIQKSENSPSYRIRFTLSEYKYSFFLEWRVSFSWAPLEVHSKESVLNDQSEKGVKIPQKRLNIHSEKNHSHKCEFSLFI